MRIPLTCVAISVLLISPVIAQDSGSCILPPQGMVAWWPAEATATDVIGGNDGTLFGETTFGPGEIGQAFSFDGVGAYVNIPDSPSIFFADDQPFTLEAWFMPLSDIPSYFILKNAAYGIRWQGRDQPLLFYNGNNHYSSRTSWELGHWYHVAVVDDGSTSVKLYVDGVLDKSDDGLARNPNRFPCRPGYGYCFSLQFGAWYEPLACSGNCIEFFQGSVDDVSLYDRALTAAEIQNIFTAGSQGKCSCPPTTCASDLAACMDEKATCDSDLLSCTDGLTSAETSLATCTSSLGVCTADLGTCNQNLSLANADLDEGHAGLIEIQRLMALPFGQRSSNFSCSGFLCPDIMAVIQQLMNPNGQNYSSGAK